VEFFKQVLYQSQITKFAYFIFPLGFCVWRMLADNDKIFVSHILRLRQFNAKLFQRSQGSESKTITRHFFIDFLLDLLSVLTIIIVWFDQVLVVFYCNSLLLVLPQCSICAQTQNTLEEINQFCTQTASLYNKKLNWNKT